MERKLYGWTLRAHIVFFSIFAALFLGFVAMAVASAVLLSYTPLHWSLIGLLILAAAFCAAWEGRAVLLLRRAPHRRTPSA